MKNFWDQRYSEQAWVYGKDPNGFFKSFIDSHTPGKLLLPAEGEGRNAAYAAGKGWEVHAVDFSHVARDKALRRAGEESLSIYYELADLSVWSTDLSFDYIALIYAHFPEAFRMQLHRKLADRLVPGGQLILEGFAKDQIHYTSGGPKDISMLYSIDMLALDFRELEIESMEKTVRVINESDFHQGKASIIRMITKKI